MPFGWFLVLLMSAGAGGGVVTGLYSNSMRTADALPFEDFDYFDTTPTGSVRADAEPSDDMAPAAGPTLASAESTILTTTLPVDDTSLFSPVLSYSSRSKGYTVASVAPAPAPGPADSSYTLASVMPAPASAEKAPASAEKEGVSYTVASVTPAPAAAEKASAPQPEAKPAAFAPVRFPLR